MLNAECGKVCPERMQRMNPEGVVDCSHGWSEIAAGERAQPVVLDGVCSTRPGGAEDSASLLHRTLRFVGARFHRPIRGEAAHCATHPRVPSRLRRGSTRGYSPAPRSGRAATSGKIRLITAALAVILLIGGSAEATDYSVSSNAAADFRGVTDAAVPGSFLESLMFFIVAGGTVLSALGVCVSRNIVRMAVWLFITLGSVALMYFLLAANFLGAIQLIVYAGGTLVLLIFGVMLTSKSPWVKFEAGFGETILAGLVCTTLLAVLVIVLFRTTWAGAEQVVPGAPLAAWGQELLTRYLVPFEVAGLLLMIVMVGAAHLARQEE